jgi:alanyl-tRNA synthetase
VFPGGSELFQHDEIFSTMNTVIPRLPEIQDCCEFTKRGNTFKIIILYRQESTKRRFKTGTGTLATAESAASRPSRASLGFEITCKRSAAVSVRTTNLMTMNKKQKKQIDALKNKVQRLQQLLNAARKQPDDPADIPQLERQIAELNAEMEKIRSE